MTDNDNTSRDWRGTPITAGALVIYGSPVSRSIALVEAVVAPEPFLTPKGLVRLNVIRRAYGRTGSTSAMVHQDRLTVVTELPPSNEPTEADKLAEWEARIATQQRNRDSHTLELDLKWSYSAHCTVCGAERPWEAPCPAANESRKETA